MNVITVYAKSAVGKEQKYITAFFAVVEEEEFLVTAYYYVVIATEEYISLDH